MDITCIPMARGFVYLAAVVDWFSRRVPAWRVSIGLKVDFCLEAVEEALARHGKPSIFNAGQGSRWDCLEIGGGDGEAIVSCLFSDRGWARGLDREVGEDRG